MLNLFRHNTFTAGVLMVLVAILFRLPILIHPEPYQLVNDAFLSNFLFGFLIRFGDTPLISYIAALVLVVIQGVMVNYTVSRHDILYKDTYLPGLMYVVLCSLYPGQFQLTSQLISNTFLILVFQRLCYLYESPKPLLLVFDSGMYLGTGLLFNYSLAIFLPFIFISVVVFTSFNLRYIIISLIGILLPVYFILVFFYVTDRLDEMVQIGLNSVEQFRLKPLENSWEIYAPWFVLLPVAAISAFGLQQNFFRNKVKTRRIIQSIGVFALFGLGALFMQTRGFVFSVLFLNIPLSIVLGYYFISTKRFWLKETMIYAVILISVYFRLN